MVTEGATDIWLSRLLPVATAGDTEWFPEIMVQMSHEQSQSFKEG